MNDPEVRALSPIFNEIDKMEKDEKFVEWARYPLPTYSNIIEEVGNKIFNYLNCQWLIIKNNTTDHSFNFKCARYLFFFLIVSRL